MSTKLLSAAWKAHVQKGPKATLVALADFANKRGEAWPSIESLVRRTGRSRRSVQGDVQLLTELGHITREERVGSTCRYLVHPHRESCTPAESAPALPLHLPRQNLRGRGAVAAPKPSKNLQEPSDRGKPKNAVIPEDWQPSEFSSASESAKVIAGWAKDELAAQLEQFKAHHAARGNQFVDPQKAWSTWVLNSRRFGTGRPANGTRYVSASGFEYRGTREQVQREAERRADNNTYWQIEGEKRREREASAAGRD